MCRVPGRQADRHAGEQWGGGGSTDDRLPNVLDQEPAPVALDVLRDLLRLFSHLLPKAGRDLVKEPERLARERVPDSLA